MRPALKRHWPLGVLALAWAVFFAPELLSSGVPYYRDTLLTYYPIVAYLHERLGALQLPRWYPFEGVGTPFIGQLVTQTFYPLAWLFLPFAPLTAVKLTVFGAYLGGLFGAYGFAREFGASRPGALTGALAFGLGGYALSLEANPNYLLGLVTLPWVGLFALRLAHRPGARRTAALALALAMLFLSGDAQAFVMSGFLLLLALGARNRWRALPWFFAAGVLSLLLVSPELLPGLALQAGSLRTIGKPPATLGVSWALRPTRLPELVLANFAPEALLPAISGELFHEVRSFWASNVFAGTIAIWLSLVSLFGRGRRAWLAGGLALLGLWLSLGDSGGLLRLAWRVVPPLHSFRYAEKYLALFWAGLGLLVALGFDRLRVRRRLGLTVALAMGGALLVFGIASVTGAAVHGMWRLACCALPDASPVLQPLSAAWSQSAWIGCGFLLAVAGLTWFGAQKRRALLAIPVLLFAELLVGLGDQLPEVAPEDLTASQPLIAAVQKTGPGATPPSRVIRVRGQVVTPTVTLGDGPSWVRSARARFVPNVTSVEHVHSFGFELPDVTARYALVFGAGGEKEGLRGAEYGGCVAVLERAQAREPIAVDDEQGYALVRVPCRARAALSATRPVANFWGASRALDHRGATSLWENGPALDASTGSVTWLQDDPEKIRLSVSTDRPTGLVLNDHFAQGWTATIGGKPATIYAADVVARGVAVPAGQHEVAFAYATPRLRAGILLGLVGLLISLALLFAPALRRRLTPPAARA